MHRQLHGTEDGGVSLPEYHEATREMYALLNDALAEIEQQHEWRDAVSGAIKRAPWFEKGEWGGDKDGWGYHVEMVGWLIREEARLRTALSQIYEMSKWTHGERAIALARETPGREAQ